ncbi:MAG: hypothetical protein QCH35_10100 [Methanomicrobiaceae archaeon]|nr:hypothetical protein [Methanomicrobiaceae archaeon]
MKPGGGPPPLAACSAGTQGTEQFAFIGTAGPLVHHRSRSIIEHQKG